ncbi:GNAT family N-acetyltransferase [Devosia naphthalenivorans]|uniref:GNAT family N-acetyltransferase n=1 Tax=Devosia naphthalenivorans TaxID=2082392 RepID=UPI000D3B38BD|nr:GNAT family protein [Devosia naphthalenivorans]
MSSLSLPIETDRLVLRTFERSDIDDLCAYHMLPTMQRYVFSRTRDEAEVACALAIMRNHVSLQRPGDTLTLAMVRKGDKILIGHVSLNWSDATAGQGEVRFCINPSYSGQGFAKEALGALLDLAFDHFRIHRIFARCDGRSHHSIKLMQQMGMRLEAHYREHALFQGEWDEELHFAILDREWQRSAKVKELPLRHRVA